MLNTKLKSANLSTTNYISSELLLAGVFTHSSASVCLIFTCVYPTAYLQQYLPKESRNKIQRKPIRL